MTAPQDRSTTVAELAKVIDATVTGDGSVTVSGLAEPGRLPGSEDLVVAFGKGMLERLAGVPLSAVLIGEDQSLPEGPRAVLVHKRPRYAFGLLLRYFDRGIDAEPGIHPSAFVDPTATLGADVSIGPMATVGANAEIGDGSIVMAQVSIGRGAKVGAGCILHSGARIGERVQLGQRCIIQPNAVIGADGFSYVTPNVSTVEMVRLTDYEVRTKNEPVLRMPSLGTVILGDEVEIGSCTTIDRATLGATQIGNRTKIDNLCQIAHNCRIGEDCAISGNCGLSGSVTIGDRVILGGGAGIADYVKVGSDAIISAAAGVAHDVPEGELWAGIPGQRRDRFFNFIKAMSLGNRFTRELNSLKKRVVAVERAAGVGENGKKEQ